MKNAACVTIPRVGDDKYPLTPRTLNVELGTLNSGAMHGEYKTPGGKLVVADFAVIDGRLRQVRISGDFFLYPEEALATITAALEGAPATADQPTLTERIAAALAPDVTMLGFSPDAVARAVRRGLGDA